ncbi:MAG: GlcNAc-transferase family protein [Pseudomonadota bacterium]
MSSSETIFVQIAAYRDPELIHTLNDLFDKAAQPERITVGVVWQAVNGQDDRLLDVEALPGAVRLIHIEAVESQGVCWARHRVQQLYDGEEYTLQIDSHMRFEQGWDDILIAMLEQCDSRMPLLTTYPPGYTPPHSLIRTTILSMRAKEFRPDGVLRFSSVATAIDDAPAKPTRGIACAAGFLFGRAQIIHDTPYDPNLYFFGEETSLTVRLWTAGWDFFHPNELVIYHYWSREGRSTHFDDDPAWKERDRIAKARVAHLLGTKQSSQAEVLLDIDRYGLGTRRTLEDYQRFSGVDFRRKTIEEPDMTIPTTQDADGPSLGSASSKPHRPEKVLESKQFIVFDNFLPEDEFERLYDYTSACDYKHINTEGEISRVWRLRDGFPLRGTRNLFYYGEDSEQRKPENKKDWIYPTGTGLDAFAEHLLRLAPRTERILGNPFEHWKKFSVTSWIYPAGTGLSLHDDGGAYQGAYVYFLNKEWNIHWGGLLLVLAEGSSRSMSEFKEEKGVSRYMRKKWLDESEENALLWEPGFAQCVLPKRNRLVIISNFAQHMVTAINASAGDSVRRSLAGFFGKKE